MNLRFVALAVLCALVPAAAMVAAVVHGRWLMAGLAGTVLVIGITRLTMLAIVYAVERDMKRWR